MTETRNLATNHQKVMKRQKYFERQKKNNETMLEISKAKPKDYRLCLKSLFQKSQNRKDRCIECATKQMKFWKHENLDDNTHEREKKVSNKIYMLTQRRNDCRLLSRTMRMHRLYL